MYPRGGRAAPVDCPRPPALRGRAPRRSKRLDPISIHFHEIALKGGNRAAFERKLRENVATAVEPLGRFQLTRYPGGFLLDGDSEDRSEVLRRVIEVCGVAHAIPVQRLPIDLEVIAQRIVAAIHETAPANFRITARRPDKRFGQSSSLINQRLGQLVQEATRLPVKLTGADLEAHVYCLKDQVLLGTDKIRGVGGLPVGTAGRVAALLSGGIDSPVAAWRLMKRGCRVDFVHFHSYPRVDRTTIEKAQELAERLTRWQYRTRLHLVPLLEIQTAARLYAPERLRVVLYRRFMVRLAQKIAHRRRCRALVTGESVGQVASQTLHNIAAVDAVANLPILRPLCGMDKQEIIDQARRVGTYEVSIQPDQDCCQLFLPRHPSVNATDEECAEAEKKMDVEGLVRDALSRTTTETYRWPGTPLPAEPAALS
jgi:tRNA uracil 4-sulfurtransferase